MGEELDTVLDYDEGVAVAKAIHPSNLTLRFKTQTQDLRSGTTIHVQPSLSSAFSCLVYV